LAKILLVTLVYAPDRVSTADMMHSLADGLQHLGHEVTVLTSIPHYFPPENSHTSLPSRGRGPYRVTNEDGVKVVRIYMPRKGRRVWSRVCDFLWFQFMVTVLGLWHGRGCRVVLVTSPPFTFGLSGVFLAGVHRAAFIYDVRELIGDVLVQSGMLRHRFLIRISYALEGFVYRRADAISTIAPSFRDRLVERGQPFSKIHLTPNFVDVDFIQPGKKDNSFSRRHHLEDAFVVLYAGNLGLTQGLEILVDVARAFNDDPKFLVLVVGEGVARAGLEKAAGESGLTNIRLLPYQPLEAVPELYATADVCVSPMRSLLSYSTVPSKIYTAIAAGRAVVAAAEPDSEAAHLIQDAEAGICVPPESREGMIEAIQKIRRDADFRQRCGASGRAWVCAHYSTSAIIARYDELIGKLAAPPDL
jgi:colanic acid biosynthesis glycosyl transferase WcaI